MEASLERWRPPQRGAVAVSPEIHQRSLSVVPDFGSLIEGLADGRRGTVYPRGHNPTVRALEEMLARLDLGKACIAFGSGMGR